MNEMKAQLQAAQDLVDALIEQRSNAENALAQSNALRRSDARTIKQLQDDLAAANKKLADLADLDHAATPDSAVKHTANGADNGVSPPA